MEYDILKPWLTLDDWQKKYIETEGNCFLLCGRQCGKTTAASIKFGRRAATKPNSSILMIALTERQSYNLFFKTLMYLEACYPRMIKRGKDKPTKHSINLTNGSKIMCHPAGIGGEGLRTYTCTDLVIDEAAPMAREVFISVTPMLAVTGGSMDIMSTPRGKEGYFYECSKKDSFTKFYISSEDCPRHDKKFLDEEKKSMSELEYAQEYLAVFLDDLKRVFSDEWLKKVCVLKRPSMIDKRFPHYIGVDIARMGKDDSSFEIIKKVDKQHLYQVESMITSKTLLTETCKKIIELDKLYDFRQIYLDAGSGGLGVSVLDFLLDVDSTKRKVVAVNNRDRSYDKDDQKKTKILKEDLYNNLLGLGERGEIQLLDDDELILSFKSIQYEWVKSAGNKTRLRIFGNYSHIVEGVIRAAFCVKDKRLNIWVR
jgi:hypothetical protein